MICSTDYLSPIGLIKLASNGKFLNGLWLDGQKYFGGTISEEMTENNNGFVFDKT